MTNPAKTKVTFLNLDIISINPFQPREKILDDEDFQGLVKSVTEHGVLEPLVVADTPVGYQLIAGERRWRAAKKSGLKEVPVHLVKTTPKGMLEMALVENVQRTNLNPLERAHGLFRLIKEFGQSKDDLAKKMSKSTTYITTTLKLLDLPDPIKDGLTKGLISEGHAKALMQIPNQKDMLTCYRQVLAIKASAAKTEQMARMFAYRPTLNSNPQAKLAQNERLINSWQANLQREMEAKADLKLNRSNNQTRITITLKGNQVKTEGDLIRIMKMMGIEEAEELLHPTETETDKDLPPIAEI